MPNYENGMRPSDIRNNNENERSFEDIKKQFASARSFDEILELASKLKEPETKKEEAEVSIQEDKSIQIAEQNAFEEEKRIKEKEDAEKAAEILKKIKSGDMGLPPSAENGSLSIEKALDDKMEKILDRQDEILAGIEKYGDSEELRAEYQQNEAQLAEMDKKYSKIRIHKLETKIQEAEGQLLEMKNDSEDPQKISQMEDEIEKLHFLLKLANNEDVGIKTTDINAEALLKASEDYGK